MRYLRFALVAGAAAGSLFVVALACAGPGRRPKDAPFDERLAAVEQLDNMVQSRFQSDQGRFGVGRIVTLPGHDNVARVEGTPDEKALLQHVADLGHPYIVAFLHTEQSPVVVVVGRQPRDVLSVPAFQPWLQALWTEAPGKAPNPVCAGFDSNGPSFPGLLPQLEACARKALPLLQKGDRVDRECGEWLVSMRPVFAAQQRCLGCHTHAKPGSTLGVMVYAFGPVRGTEASGANVGSTTRR